MEVKRTDLARMVAVVEGPSRPLMALGEEHLTKIT